MSDFSVGHLRSCFDSLLKFAADVNLLVLETFFFFPECHSESVIPYYLWLCRFADWAVYTCTWPVNGVSQSAEVSENICCNNTIHRVCGGHLIVFLFGFFSI